MVEPIRWALTGHAGQLAAVTWPNPRAGWLAVLAHDHGEHIGRYRPVAEALLAAGAVVVGHDHAGHGHSAGERVLISDFDRAVDDQRMVLQQAATDHPGLPIVLVGQGMGATIAVRYAQRHSGELAALVLSAPVLGFWAGLDVLADERIPDKPIEPTMLSRDPATVADYAADPLVWHGPYRRQTLLGLDACLNAINFGGSLGDELPALWLHGEDDELVPEVDTRTGMDRIRGLNFAERSYPGARHDVFHETNSAEVLADLVAFVRAAISLPPAPER